MCGIAGLIDPASPARAVEETLRCMTSTLFHRGPDDGGTFAANGVGLGMRRLAIIDVASGQQPVSTEDGTIQVVVNGEIYNFLELRAELARAGHTFRTRSDSEVIAHMYEEHGVDFLARLRGMFAIALWDKRAQRLLLARDRMGKKPLFYALLGDRLFFGSEIKALLAAAPRRGEPVPSGLPPYLRFGFVPEPRTMFRDVHKLPAAHFLVHEAGATRIAPYWTLRFEADPRPSQAEWREKLDAALEEAVRIRLMSEVPLGSFLSGGIDSSAVVAYMRRAGVQPLRTFTIGFDRPEWDESADAAAVAARLDTDHHVLRLREEDLTANLPATLLALVRQFDEPFGDSSALPTYHVSRLAREHVTVILSGDGGDELFAGYPSYRGLRFAESYRRLPAWLAQTLLPAMARGVASHLPLGRRYGALRVAKVLHDSALPFPSMYLSKSAVCAADAVRRVLTPDARLGLAGDGDGVWPPDIDAVMRSALPSVSKASYADFRFRLLDDMLVKVDRMSMAHGLEVRCPLLDHRLVELVARMPPGLKLRGFETKAVFRDTVRPYLPARTVRKRKQGFSVPLREWLRTRLREMVGDYLEAGGGRLPSALFDRRAVAAMLAEHHRGAADYSQLIWSLLNYAAWQELYVERGGRPD
jgi:asparagine synthase (glutamine-hydrolysing)